MNGKNVFTLVLVIILVLVLGYIEYARLDYELNGPPATPEPSPSETVSPTPTPRPSPTPPPRPSDTPFKTPEPTPEPTPSLPDVDITSWELRLVNSERPLDGGYLPEVRTLENGQSFDERAADALEAFIAGAREAGLSVVLTSSYRPYATQEYLFNNKLQEQYNAGLTGDTAYAAAARIVAVPGTSEHQLGLAADIVDRYYEYMNESLAATDLSKWMKEHSAEYGFILRFPEDKQDITKIMFEPWHYRYVGVEAATYIMEHSLCLEEFVALYEDRG